ncbi:hypothetical protein MAM1_0013d01354 [Mucor ambiguus]|uniref:Uncharacterized protein n=1 Tax=Mucor ambiguus TaxID=91626 RepID=A0A0C9MFN2_9FUNG|nr:hypothetical protein MAM1_0013d01354 [Mucor ambiguus]
MSRELQSLDQKAPTKGTKMEATPRSSNKRPKIFLADARWCVDNVQTLTAKSFAQQFQYTSSQICHARFREIVDNHIPEDSKKRILTEFDNWRDRMDSTIFWKEQAELGALVKADAVTSKAANSLLVNNASSIAATAEDFNFNNPLLPVFPLPQHATVSSHAQDHTATTATANALHLSTDYSSNVSNRFSRSPSNEVLEQTIWEEWLSLYETMGKESLFAYSPILYNVIRIGYGLNPPAGVPLSIYYQTIQQYSDMTTNIYQYRHMIIDGNEKYIDMFIDANNMNEMKQSLELMKHHISDAFLYEICKAIYSIYNPTTVDIKHSEAVFNHFVLAPTLKAICKTLYCEHQTTWYPGEEKLDALLTQLKKLDPTVDRRHGYNADSIKEFKSGGVGIRNHYKGMFALLSMLKAVADKYEHVTIETMLKQKVFFLQAYNESLYLWSMKAVEKNLYCLCREKKVAIPHDFLDRQETVLEFICFVNEMKVILDDSLHNLQILEQEHKANSKKRRYIERDSYQTLEEYIRPTVIKVSLLKGYRGMADNEPTSGLDMSFL